jgi:hypothetical protein
VKERMELRLGPELRQKLDALAVLSGKSASATIRRLILAAHSQAFEERPAKGPSSASVCPHAPVGHLAPSMTAQDNSNARLNMSTDDILKEAGIGLAVPCGSEGP